MLEAAGLALRYVTLNAKFKLAKMREFPPDFTFMSKMCLIRRNGTHIVFDSEEKAQKIPGVETNPDMERIARIGKAGYLPTQLHTIGGELLDIYRVRVNDKLFTISRMDWKGAKFLNVQVKFEDTLKGTGILGQTTLPENERYPNERFEVLDLNSDLGCLADSGCFCT